MAYASRRKQNAKKRRATLKMDQPINAVVKKCEELIGSKKSQYRTFKIPKRNGKLRTINAPSDELKKVSRELLKIVDSIAERNQNDVGFVKGKGFTDATHIHLKNRKIEDCITINVDLENFFPSITDKKVTETLVNEVGLTYKEAKTITKAINANGGLVQGNPASPAIASLAIRKIDHVAEEFANSQGGTYSRYADDLTILIPCGKTWRQESKEIRNEKATLIGGFVNRLNCVCETKVNRSKVHVKWPRRVDSTAEIVGVKVGAKGFAKSKRCTRRAIRYWTFLRNKGLGYHSPERNPRDNLTAEQVSFVVLGHHANQVQMNRLERSIMRNRPDGCYGTEMPRPRARSKYRPTSECNFAQQEARRRKAKRYREKHKADLKAKKARKRQERKH